MEASCSLNIEEIREFIASRGGKVSNHDLVKHFKDYLTNPDQKEIARETFKKYVNRIGTIKNENGDKYIVLKKKKSSASSQPASTKSEESFTFSPSTPAPASLRREPPPYVPPPSVLEPLHNTGLRQNVDQQPPEDIYTQELSQPKDFTCAQVEHEFQPPEPLYKPANDTLMNSQEMINGRSDRLPQQDAFSQSRVVSDFNRCQDNLRRTSVDTEAPPLVPRKPSVHSLSSIHIVSSSDNLDPSKGAVKKNWNKFEAANSNDLSDSNGAARVMKKQTSYDAPFVQAEMEESITYTVPVRSESCRSLNSDCEPVSVKERLERFNKISVLGSSSRRPSVKREKNSQEEDQVSVSSLSPAGHEWVIKMSSCDYQVLAKMLAEEPKLVRVRDPTTGNVLHWAAKQGNEDVIKLCAGKCPDLVNQKSNGGFTSLHIATQFRHEGICNLLTQVYGADREIRDNSGRKARQYQHTEYTCISPDTYRRIMGKRKPDQKFLRIGSLNIRVKKTTHAVSNFFGASASQINAKWGKLTSWGSAGDVQDDGEKMPPPQSTKVKRRAKKYLEQSRSTPSTPNQARSSISNDPQELSPSPSSSTVHDSDSDTACGFDANWQKTS